MNIALTDTTTLEELFARVDEWSNLPSSSLSPQQIALIGLRNTVFETNEELKAGGGLVFTSGSSCFICFTGV
ncbi:MAG: hypothetical protein QM401_10055 [Bacillota bacterium]|nr:hypothetical protein [Bacillota bacterium]